MSPLRTFLFANVLALVAATGLAWLAVPAQARTDDTYTAIAYSEKTGRYGYSHDYSSSDEAKQRALAECKADDAKVLVCVGNGWCALALSDGSEYGFAYGGSESIARRIALQECRDRGGKNAHIVVSVYSGD
ncbi:MAG TPA: DUF4189 domain-containing protein [Gemmataceae bacterium]|nr:DUF4189 domain-containing protein [Gemmataceae bacterium]